MRGALAAQFARHRDAEQALGARGGDRLFGKPRFAIDRSGMVRRNRGDLLGARDADRRCRRRQIVRSRENTARGAACRLTSFSISRSVAVRTIMSALAIEWPPLAFGVAISLRHSSHIRIHNSSWRLAGISALLWRKGYQSKTAM